jgi:hypothetical protein
MKKENKELLLKDLYARLPYRTMVKCNTDGRHEFDEELSDIHIMNFYQFKIKPYLRPMSSMTEEELCEVQEILGKGVEIREGFILIVDSSINSFSFLELQAVFDWLNAHHFDYRYLIPKGLALEASEGIYNIKKK